MMTTSSPPPSPPPPSPPSPPSSFPLSSAADFEMENITHDTRGVVGFGQAGRRRSDVRHFLQVHASEPQFTTRAVVVGLFVGTIVNFSNMYFGLQTGWISMMSMPSSLIGFAMFKSFSSHLKYPFTPVENVLVQTVAVAVGSMPLSAGFVGAIPALENLLLPSEGGPLYISTPNLILWSLGVAFFGVFFAVPLRKQVIIKEKLKFPSGTATALMISVLHGKGRRGEEAEVISSIEVMEQHLGSWKEKTRLLGYAFTVSGVYTLTSYFFPLLRNVPIFGKSLAANYLWTLNPSPAYVGQGVIMGTSTTLHMLLGAIIGWGVLSPLAKLKRWAPGPVDDWVKGSRGWIVWVSLAIMLSDSVISLGGLVLEPVVRKVMVMREGRGGGPYQRLLQGDEGDAENNSSYESVPTSSGEVRRRRRRNSNRNVCNSDLPDEDAPPSHLVPNIIVYTGLAASAALCILSVSVVFPSITLVSSLVAFTLALVLSVMGVRALGQTDLNPVSGISKLTQLFFALLTPRDSPTAVLTNIVAGAISEAGAQQAGDIMQDLKTGHLIGAAPRAQFFGQLVGSVFGAVISAGVYRLYTNVYPVPGELFQVPTAYVWVDCSRLVFGEGLPYGAWECACVFAAVFAVTTALKGWVLKAGWKEWVPGGIAVAVGMYNVPSFTLARVVGGGVTWWWNRQEGVGVGNGEEETMLVILASGLILGEGIGSVVNLGMASVGVPHW